MVNYKQQIYQYYFSKRVNRDLPTSIQQLANRQPFYLNLIDKYFPKDKNLKIVELGCGYGAFLYFVENAGYQNIMGVDNSSEMVDAAKKLGINNVQEGDITEYLKKCSDKSIDVLLLIDVIEHFTKLELYELVGEFYRVLATGGKVICHQPNAEGLFGNAILYGDYTHEQAFTRVSMAQLFLSNGFSGVSSFEDKPLGHGIKRYLRKFIWTALLRPFYLFLIAVESGGSDKNIILTKNFCSVITK